MKLYTYCENALVIKLCGERLLDAFPRHHGLSERARDPDELLIGRMAFEASCFFPANARDATSAAARWKRLWRSTQAP